MISRMTIQRASLQAPTLTTTGTILFTANDEADPMVRHTTERAKTNGASLHVQRAWPILEWINDNDKRYPAPGSSNNAQLDGILYILEHVVRDMQAKHRISRECFTDNVVGRLERRRSPDSTGPEDVVQMVIQTGTTSTTASRRELTLSLIMHCKNDFVTYEEGKSPRL